MLDISQGCGWRECAFICRVGGSSSKAKNWPQSSAPQAAGTEKGVLSTPETTQLLLGEGTLAGGGERGPVDGREKPVAAAPAHPFFSGWTAGHSHPAGPKGAATPGIKMHMQTMRQALGRGKRRDTSCLSMTITAALPSTVLYQVLAG